MQNINNNILFYNDALWKIPACEKKSIHITEVIQEGQIGVTPKIQRSSHKNTKVIKVGKSVIYPLSYEVTHHN